MKYSIIIPIYNRPDELDELLYSITVLDGDYDIEIVVIEDGSQFTSKKIIKKYQPQLDLKYLVKENTGPGDSRNFGMKQAHGDYFIILDSDCILPPHYLNEVDTSLKSIHVDAFGGPDKAHTSFTTVQKAINYSMTSFLTTGGIRGNEKLKSKFQLRSFNLGLSRKAFAITQGFSKQRFGEDIDLSFRLWHNNLTTKFIAKAFVYHKRRTNWSQFFKQTFNFGAARPILNNMHPNSAKITFWFPSIFLGALLISAMMAFFGIPFLIHALLLYFTLILIDATIKNKSIMVGVYAIVATLVQFTGYGLGFLRSIIRLHILRLDKKKSFPKMFNN